MLSGFNGPEDGMNVGKTLFAQVMEFVPWKTFGRIIARHKADRGVRTLSCADLFRVLAFSQLTWRESLRDIEIAGRLIDSITERFYLLASHPHIGRQRDADFAARPA
jgi:hypothetical protein